MVKGKNQANGMPPHARAQDAQREQPGYRSTQDGLQDADIEYQDFDEGAEVAVSTYRRRRWRPLRWVAGLLALALLVYMVVQVFVVLAPRMQTQIAIGSSMTDSLTVPGFVVMKSTSLEGAGGILYYTAPVGQRVSVGTEVALVFDTEEAAAAQSELDRVNNELALLTSAQNTVAEGGDVELLTKQLNAGVRDLISDIQTGDYSGIEDPCDVITLAGNKIQIAVGDVADFEVRIAALNQEKAALEAVAVPVGSITADKTGYFVPSGRGDRVMSEYDSVAEYTPAAMQEALAAPAAYYAPTVVGHIVTDYKWSYFALVPAKEADKFVEGAKLDVAFPEILDETLPVTVQTVTVDEALGVAKVELRCEYINPQVLSLRNENTKVVFSTQEGLRIDKNALRLVDVEAEDGTVTTHKGVYVKFGNMVYFRRVKILLEDEHYMLVSAVYEKDVNEVQMYDEVVVDAGGEELYDRKIL